MLRCLEGKAPGVVQEDCKRQVSEAGWWSHIDSTGFDFVRDSRKRLGYHMTIDFRGMLPGYYVRGITRRPVAQPRFRLDAQHRRLTQRMPVHVRHCCLHRLLHLKG